MARAAMCIMGVALATLFFAFLFLTTASAVEYYGTVTQTTLEDFNAGELYHTGLTRSAIGGGEGNGEVRLLVVGIAGEWYTDTNHTGLPALAGLAAVQHNGTIYVIAGDNGTAKTNAVYYSHIITTTHDLTNWQPTSALPTGTYPYGLYHHGAAVLNNRIYVVGGWDQVNMTGFFNTVSHAPINADGTLGAWSTTTALPKGIVFARMVALNGRLYVLGGQQWDAPNALNTVYHAEPDPVTGVIAPGGWLTTTVLPNQTYGHMVATFGDRIYVAGGYNGGLGGHDIFYPYVNYATPISTTGVITAGGWMTTTNMKHNIYGGAALAFSGELFTTGGAKDNNQTPSDYVGAGLIERDGTILSWVDTSLIDPKRFYHAAVSSDDGWLYVIGGAAQLLPPPAPTQLTASINRGATAGEARNYAPYGDFTSSIIDIGRDRLVRGMSWGAYISDTQAMTVALGYRTRPQGGTWSAWSDLYPSGTPAGNITTTVELSTTARFVQYAAYLDTSVSSWTPVLNWVQFKYVIPSPDLKLSKNDSRSVVHLGDVLTYTFWYTNVGGAPAIDVYITETVPLNTVPYGPNTGWVPLGGNHYGLYATDILSPTESGSAMFVVRVDDEVPQGTGSIYDQALVGNALNDENPTDNHAYHSTPLEWIDLRVALTDGLTTTRPGEVLTYTTIITNVGSAPATNVVISLTLPADVSPSGSNTGWTDFGGGRHSYTVSAVEPIASSEVTFTARVNIDVAPTVAWLTTTVSAGDDGTHGPDPHPADNTAQDTTALAWVNLQVTKSDGVDVVEPADVITYTIHYTNAGRMEAGGVVLTELFTGQASYVGSGWVAQGGNLYRQEIGTLAGQDGAGTTTFVLRVDDAATAGTLLNHVEIRYDEAYGPDIDPASAVDTDEDAIVILPPDLQIAKSDGTYYVTPGDILTYTITYTNTGPGKARGIVITDTLPDQTAFLGGTEWQLVTGRTYTRTVPNLSVGQHATAIIVAQVDDPAIPGLITNTVSIGAVGEENWSQNTALDVDEILEYAPDLVVEISDGVTSVPVCQVLNYTIQYRNDGERTATGIVLSATLPAGMTYVGTGWQDAGNRQYTRSVPDLGSGAADSVTFSTILTKPVTLDQAAAPARATAEADQPGAPSWPDPIIQTVTIRCVEQEDARGNESTDEDALLRPDLRVQSITPNPVEPIMGQPATFRVVIANDGDTAITNNCCTGFWTDLYVDPGHRPGEKEPSNVDVYSWIPNVSAQGTRTLDLAYTFQTTGTFTIYVQANADRYWGIPEPDFANNTGDPITVTVIDIVEIPKLYLPIILRL
ncbi:MAG: DUF11 domain-containing protein [Chloroflexi bacterium]|nr:DUF11 domain-containing protein [Chloroflexota bacterium]MBU1749513.1 DUF11 domain-containing protein [Chloroflexota bacterium]